MQYKVIIQELRASENPNVRAFVQDMEKLKPLTKKERDYCLKNRCKPKAVTKLVGEFIPYITMVAYAYSEKTKTLTVLDLINEGILGAYAAFDRNERRGEALTKRRVYEWIKKYIRKAVYSDTCQGNSMYVYSECLWDDSQVDEDGIIDDVNGKWLRQFLTSLILEKMGDRNGSIIIEYYLGDNDDLKAIGDKYGVGRERVRQIINNFTPLYRRMENIKSLRGL